MKLRVISRQDLMKNNPDAWCTLLGLLGFSLKTIGRETGLSVSQVAYRLGKRGIRLMDYRNGRSQMARYVIANTAEMRHSSPAQLELHKTLRLPREATK